jgi:hypothetical protein
VSTTAGDDPRDGGAKIFTALLVVAGGTFLYAAT